MSPSGCELSTKEISETEAYVELESVSYQIFVYPSGVASGYLTKDKECKLFLTTPKCKITVKNNKLYIEATHDLEEAVYFNGRIFVFGSKPVKVLKTFETNLQNAKSEILELI